MCSYRVYLLKLTVLETVLRELRDLKCYKCLGGDAVTRAWESTRKAGQNSKNVCKRVWDRKDAPGATHWYISSHYSILPFHSKNLIMA
jgi:hypothetical protein